MKSAKQQDLIEYLLRYHRHGATVAQVKQGLADRNYPIAGLRQHTQIHVCIWCLWEMGLVRSQSENQSPNNPGQTYWIPQPKYVTNKLSTTSRKTTSIRHTVATRKRTNAVRIAVPTDSSLSRTPGPESDNLECLVAGSHV